MDSVRQWMTTPAIVAAPAMTLPEARRLLKERRIRRLPVVDADGRLAGIVTEGDINRVSDSRATDVREVNLYHRAADLPIGDIMTAEVVSVGPDAPIKEVARLLLHHRIGGIPVVERGAVIGMITESDLFRLIVVQEVELNDESSELGSLLE
jgi:CBS domain-containing protein